MNWLDGSALGASLQRCSRKVATTGLAVVVLGALLACKIPGAKSKDVGAKEHFATAHSCPEDQVNVKPRPDLDWMEVQIGASLLGPPPEVASDPARLAKWQEDRAKKKAKQVDEYEVFEVLGCGHHEYLGCIHPRPVGQGKKSANLAVVNCSSKKVGEASAADLVNKAKAGLDVKLDKAAKKTESAEEKLKKAQELADKLKEKKK